MFTTANSDPWRERPFFRHTLRARPSRTEHEHRSRFALTLPLVMALAGTGSAHAHTTVKATERDAEPAWSFDIGGRIQLDLDSFEGVYSETGERATETYLRRARIEFSGRAYEHLRFGLDVAPLENGSGRLDTLIVSYSGLGPLVISAGRFKPDFSLEEATSSKWVTGIERSAIWDLAPAAADRGGSWGLDLRTHGKHHHASVGVYDKPEQRALALRAVVAPLLAQSQVLHAGLSYSRENIDTTSNGRIRSRLGVRGVTETGRGNEVTLAPSAGGSAFDGDHAAVLEFAYVHGPYSVQSEYLQRRLAGTGAQPNRVARGQYVQFAYTLSGETRPYDIDGGKFEELRPANGSKGAWEVFYRHDRLAVKGEVDLLDPGQSRARARVHAVGVNWYVKRSLRLSANYLWGTTNGIVNDAGDDSGQALSLRLQLLI